MMRHVAGPSVFSEAKVTPSLLHVCEQAVPTRIRVGHAEYDEVVYVMVDIIYTPAMKYPFLGISDCSEYERSEA